MHCVDIDTIRRDFPALRKWTYRDTSFVGLFPRRALVQISQVSYVNGFRFDLKEVADARAIDHV